MVQPAEILAGMLQGEGALGPCPRSTELAHFCRQVTDVSNAALLLNRISMLLVTLMKELEALDSTTPFFFLLLIK